MPRTRLRRFWTLPIYWPAAMFISGRMHSVFQPFWWSIAQLAGTNALAPAVFAIQSQLWTSIFYGFVLGLIPLRVLGELVQSALARFRTQPPAETGSSDELDWRRPILWAWTLPAFVLFLRMVFMLFPRQQSVLGTDAKRPDLWTHFFTPLPPVSDLTQAWMYDRVEIVMPMLFLMAYAAAVWFRHRLPRRHVSSGHEIDPIPSADTLGV